jgi:hypothetical protein
MDVHLIDWSKRSDWILILVRCFMKAFPCEWVEYEKGDFFDLDTGVQSTVRAKPKVDTGMDLRDYFAAKAMQADISSITPEMESKFGNEHWEIAQISYRAYQMADAMMKARETK